MNEIVWREKKCIELDRLDSNCNDCASMVRDFDKFNESVERHRKWQQDYFDVLKTKLIEKAKEHKLNGKEELFETLMQEARDMRFQFDKKEAAINYGTCSKYDKPVSFLPNTCQLETQHCFVHRKDA